MRIGETVRRGMIVLLVFVPALTALPQPVRAEEGPGEIRLRSGFFSGVKFTRGDEAPRPVYGFGGFSLHSGFSEVLGEHPPALRCARRSVVWKGIGTVGLLGILGSTIVTFADAVQDANDVESGKAVDDSPNWGPVGVLAASGVLFLAGAIGSNAEMKHGIALFNAHARERSAEAAPGRRGSPLTTRQWSPFLEARILGRDPAPRPGGAPRWAAGLTLHLG